MKLIQHRRNTIEELIDTDHNYGVEVDIRSSGGDLIIHHDPLVTGEFFDAWIEHYQHSTLILNVKEEGLEARLIEKMQQYRIEDYFFLDQSFPFIVKWVNQGEHRCAVRVSEFESIDTALTLAGKVDWVWVDCFTHFPLDCDQYQMLIDAGFKLCIVSPELQGRLAEEEIPVIARTLMEQSMKVDAVCTKCPGLWEQCTAQ